ncbi:hypothetical protein N7495_000879 [Penicillium taxi]|uniref:uncharacterized protein n=1 Tax=Penicillium taxi TaxID=168475 RepID=UPI002544DB88|nr:uncharacterized protein N7495_000879 [Penicillium taxi]KAJ5908197.1 hypothetical protein N7495_000879 [Penicillium taxi]
MADTLRKKLVCQIVDDTAYENPEKLFCIHPIFTETSKEWRRVTMGDLADAVNYTAQWIEKTIGLSSQCKSFVYLGANDIRYATITLACIKTRHSVLLISPRNSEAGSLHILNETKTSKIIYSPEQRKVVEALLNADRLLQSSEFPALWETFGKKVDQYPCAALYADLENEVPIIIHSSGTTGFPKPVPFTNGYLSAFDNTTKLPVPPGRRGSMMHMQKPGALQLVCAPFFHLMGYAAILESICHGIPFVLSPEKPMTVELLAKIYDETNPDLVWLPPSIIESIGVSTVGLDLLKRFEIIFFAGAPLSPVIGDKLCADGIRLQSLIGSSEASIYSNLAPKDPKDWEWLEWNPSNPLFHMQYSADNLYELVLQRSETRDFAAIFHTYPEISEYRTKDLFVPHPTKPNLWRYKGRLDDVIVLSNGEKFNPIEMEKVIEGHPLVASALVVGQGRFQSALVIEPNWEDLPEDFSEGLLIEKTWPIVEKANKIAPAHARVLKTKIGIASKSKPFQKTPKGSVQHRLTMSDYAEEIDAIYERSDEEHIVIIPQDSTLQEVKKIIQDILSQQLEIELVSETSDIFALGLDSLQTLRLSKILQGAISSYRPTDSTVINPQKLYSHPTVAQLSGFIYNLINGIDAVVEAGKDQVQSRHERIDALIKKYTKNLPIKQVHSFNRESRYAVVLTGSTGSLGNYILSELIKDPQVSKIYCLNRSEDAGQRQILSLEEKGIVIPSDFSSRVEFLQASFGAEKFGLPMSKYEELTKTVDTVIHNAWKVNFNHNVAAFEHPHIEGMRRFIDFSLESTHSAHIHFISSISTIGGWTKEHGPSVPEIPLEDPDVALVQGYGESKFVSERICAISSARSGVPTSFHRVGQIAGPTTEKGVWNRQEWVPAIIATSKTIKKVPTAIGDWDVDWIPVDSLAKIVVEITRSRRETENNDRTAAFNLVNPFGTSWKSLIPPIEDRYSVEPIIFSDWIAALSAFANPTEADFNDKPALKILDFYRSLNGEHGKSSMAAPVQTTHAQGASETMRTLGPVNAALMETWLRQWNF